MATKVYKPKRKISATESEEIKIPASSVDGLSTVATSGSYNDLSNKPTIPDVSDKLSKTENTGVNVLGTTKSTTTLGGNQLVAPNGIIFAGTAANAGLVTRGICGVTTPDSKGACSKENLYINYDGNNDFNAGRQVVLNAGAVGNHLGSNMYQYAVPRGDIVKAWVEAQGYTKNKGTVTQVKINGTTKSPDSAGLVDLGTISGGGSSNVIVDRPMIQGVEYTVFDSGEYGSFIGTFSLETQNSSITITVGNAYYIITNNDWVHCRITIDKNDDFMYSTIAINTGDVNRTWSFSTLPSSGAVKISTDLSSSYMEHSICVIMKEVI